LTVLFKVKYMKFNIIVISHNQFPTSLNCLNFIYKHTPRSKFDLIWLDNGSEDDTYHFLRPKISDQDKYIRREKNLGVIRGRNLAFAHTENYNDATIYVDNDQYVGAGWIDEYEEGLRQGYDLLGQEAWWMTNILLPKKQVGKNQCFTYISGCGLAMSTRLIQDIGLFDERFNPAYFEDPDIAFRAYKKNYKAKCFFSNRVQHLKHQTLGNVNFSREKQFIASYQEFKKKWNVGDIPKFCT